MSLLLLGCGGFGVAVPTLLSATVASDGTTLTLVFDQSVTFQNVAFPHLNTVNRDCLYSSGSPGASLVFTVDSGVVEQGTHEVVALAAGAVKNAGGIGNSEILADVVNNSTQTAPSNTVAPSVTGAASQGQVLTCTTGTWTGSVPITYAYQWQNSGDNSSFSNIVGATANTYALQSGDVSKYVRCRVTATNVSGPGTANSNSTGPVTAPAAPTLRATAQTSDSGLYGSYSVTMPTFYAGDVLVASLMTAQASGVTATGWTQVGAYYNGALVYYVYAKQAVGGDLLTVTGLTEGSVSALVHSYLGGSLGQTNSQLNIASPQINAPTVTATATASRLVNVYFRTTGGGTVTPPAGQTVYSGPSAEKWGVEQVSAGATGTRSATRSASGNSLGASVIISGS